jgi:hypothetical protein
MRRSYNLTLGFVLLNLSCAGFQFPTTATTAMQPIPPEVSIANIRVAEMPTGSLLAAYLCERYVPAPMNVVVCRAFGPSVSASDLNFAFDLELDVANPNRIPLPVVQALVGFTDYPGQAEQNLGALCVSFCEVPTSCPQDAASACQSDDPEIRDLESFAGAAANFLLRAAAGQTSVEDLRLQTVAPGESARVVIRLRLQPVQLLELMQQTGEQTLGELRSGRVPSFVIPYRIEGSAWVRIENFGRLAVNFGPSEGEWRLGDAL